MKVNEMLFRDTRRVVDSALKAHGHAPKWFFFRCPEEDYFSMTWELEDRYIFVTFADGVWSVEGFPGLHDIEEFGSLEAMDFYLTADKLGVGS